MFKQLNINTLVVSLAAIVCAFMVAPVQADVIRGYQCVSAIEKTLETRTLLDSAALNGAASTLDFTVDTNGASILSIDTQFTHANNGALTWTCTGLSAAETTASNTRVATTLTTCSVSSGTCTLKNAGVFTTESQSADYDYNTLVGVVGQEQVTCTISHGGSPAAGDTVIVTARLCND